MLVIISLIKIPDKRAVGDSTDMWSSIKRIFKKERFVMGVIAQMFYVGAQIMCWTYIYHYAEHLGVNNQNAVNYAYVALGIFLLGRFFFTYLLKFIESGKLLMILSMLAICFCLGTIFIQGMGGLYCLVLISFCMSLMFPTIYGIALYELGEDAKSASAFLVMAIVGGAFMPILQGMILDIGGSSYADTEILGVPEVNFSFILPLICFLVVSVYGYRTIEVYNTE